MSATPLSMRGLDRHTVRTRTASSSAWLREPLLHFLLLGALLYVASRVFAPGTDSRIVIDVPRVERLARLYELQTGVAPSGPQRERLIEDFVRDEALYREARKLGLDEGDELVRRRLVQKMEFLRANADLAEPAEAQLRVFYREHAAKFTAPARLSFTHVYFSPDGRGGAAAREAAAAALQGHLVSNADMALGNRSPIPTRFDNVTRDEVQLAFGQRPIVDALMQAPPGQWTGPVESGYGWHLVRVSERAAPAPLTFEQARDAVAEAWQREARLQTERARTADLMHKYTVIRNDQSTSTR